MARGVWDRTARSARRFSLLALLGVLALGAWGAYAVFAANGPATPSISSGPANPTSSTSATFVFSDSTKNVTFNCKIDTTSFNGCVSGHTYTVAAGSHTFSVAAVSGSSSSSAATYPWTVDQTPPAAPAISTKPTDPSDNRGPQFGFTATETGETFLCALDTTTFTACANPVSYPNLTVGSHTFKVEGKDTAGNVSTTPTSYTWTIVPPAPSITAKPANPTNSTAASFSFTDSLAGVTFQCALDSNTFSACTSPKSYPAQGEGTHTFQVKAISGAFASSATSYTWTVDLTAPAITVSFPANNGIYNANGWNNGCSGGAGLCGSATDPSGVAAGLVSIQQQSTGKWWGGSSFNQNSEVFQTATKTGGAGTTFTGRYPLALPADGLYTVHVRATDGVGNTTSAANQVVLSFRIDTAKPNAPVFDQTPPNPNTTATSTFKWHDTSADVDHYLCSVENGAFQTTVPSDGQSAQACVSPLTYNVPTTNNGQHQFAVEAVDAAGNVSQSVSYSWKVQKGTAADFTITGHVDVDTTGVLYPGVWRTIPLTLTNPNSDAAIVTSITVTLGGPTTGSCIATSNIDLQPSPISTTMTVTIPANGSTNVPVALRPQIRLKPGAANTCQNVSFSLTYSGSAHS